MKRYLVPVVAGVTVFGAVSAFAATLDVSSTTLGAGDKAVASCNATASVTYTTTYDTTAKTYRVATAPVATAATCAGKAFKVTLTGASGVLREVTGDLDDSGAAAPSFAGNPAVPASAVTGVSVVITG